METLIKIGKNTVKFFLCLVGVLAFLLLVVVPCLWLSIVLIFLLMAPYIIGVMIDCTPLVLFGIIFFIAGVSILKYHSEHKVKDE